MLTLLAISSLLVEDGIKADDVYTALLVGGVMQSGKKTCFPMCKPDLRKGLHSVIALQSFCTKASSQFGLSDWFPTTHKPTGGDGQEEYEYEQSGSVSGGGIGKLWNGGVWKSGLCAPRYHSSWGRCPEIQWV